MPPLPKLHILSHRHNNQEKTEAEKGSEYTLQCFRGRAVGSDCLDSYLALAIYDVSVSKLLISSAPQFLYL